MESVTHLFASTFQHPGLIAAAALSAMAIEYLANLPDANETHDVRETASSLTIAVINKTVGYLTAGITALPLLILYEYRIFTIPADNVLALLTAFVLTDFCYYWHHFAMHKVRVLWASHSVHHSATRLNLTAAVRLGLGGQLAGGFLFYSPLVLLGFHPLVVYAMLGLGLAYQLFIHPAKAPDLGPLEWVLNTPKHHQVHHASNAPCLDKNFGGVFIVFDRLFGTFAKAPEDESLQFGLVGKRPTNNPLAILFGEWARIARDLIRARSLKDVARSLFSMKPRTER
ncbi:sterol desaturase family protein [Rhizobium sp. C4]|uniref:sterol desaturase family protein n=1 Tax=Rhizobium sp. C4 TaxID=1349800 RepID=UPI001E457F7C|nr:sterol desaturase family protein [Rhizobium sp. C4]MCD2174145.1 sterol desaturase family protein [Rhizobium sp. C4]